MPNIEVCDFIQNSSKQVIAIHTLLIGCVNYLRRLYTITLLSTVCSKMSTYFLKLLDTFKCGLKKVGSGILYKLFYIFSISCKFILTVKTCRMVLLTSKHAKRFIGSSWNSKYFAHNIEIVFFLISFLEKGKKFLSIEAKP